MEQVVELPDGFVDVLDDDPVGDSVVEEDSVAGLADVVALRTLDLETLLAAVDRVDESFVATNSQNFAAR